MPCDNPKHQLIFHEYDNLTSHIALYGNLSWKKSQFFFAVESIAFAGVGVAFRDTFLKGASPEATALFLFIVVCLFNFWLCYVWFNTNRRNREYLDPLLKRARRIEKKLGHVEAMYSAQRKSVESLMSKRKIRTSQFERHIPSGFALAWAVALLIAAWHGNH